MNKKAWVRIVESFVAVLLIAAVLLTVINQNIPVKQDNSEKMYSVAGEILKAVLLNDNLRREILIEDTDWTDTRTKIGEITPTYLRCVPTICPLPQENLCVLERSSVTPSNKVEVYTQSAIIMAERDAPNSQTYVYEPRMIRLFCWLQAEDV
ncbi:MAG: hypothetical protein Q7R52_00435 [archaeon]|nr:hypothetical protein [archaeon]